MANSCKGNIWIERELILSPAFHKLNGTGKTVLFLFLYRRQWEKAGRKGKWLQTNNGEIIFTYHEAQKKFGISKSSFARAISQLVQYGFINISHLGGGMVRDCSKYSLSNRWRDYGTETFVEKTRPKDTRKLGFTTKNWEEMTGRKRREKHKIGINNDTCPSSEIDTHNANPDKPSSIKNDTEEIEIDVNYFIAKGKEVFRAYSSPQYQN
jgi:hypothetical protein